MKLKHRKVLQDNQIQVGTTVHFLPMPTTFSDKPFNSNGSSSSLMGPGTTTTSSSNNNLKPFTSPHSFDSSMALTILVLLSAIFFMGFFSIYLRCFNTHFNSLHQNLSRTPRRRNPLNQTSSSSVPVITTSGGESSSSSSDGLDQITIKSLPLLSYLSIEKSKKQEEHKSTTECVICLGEFEETDILKMIPYCQHYFHQDCINTWFFSHSSCPICRSTKLFVVISSSSPNDSDTKIDQNIDNVCLIGTGTTSINDNQLDHGDEEQQNRESPEKVSVMVVDDSDSEVVVVSERQVMGNGCNCCDTMRRTLSCSSILGNKSSMASLNSQLRRSSSSRFF